MIDLRGTKFFDLKKAKPLKEGVTYVYTDPEIRRPIVLKLFSYFGHQSDHFLIQEFHKMASLSGQPEIGTVFFLASLADDPGNRSCYVMEYIDGVTLNEYLEQNPELSFEAISEIIIQLASAMEKAHNYEIYHGDLDGNNIMIDKMGYLKVIDFLWFSPSSDNIGLDLKRFNNILGQLKNRYRSFDGYIAKFLINHCALRDSFKGLRKELQLIDGISFELRFLDLQSRRILSKLFSHTELDSTLKKVLWIKGIDIPPERIPDMTEKWERMLSANRSGGISLQYSDEREEKILYAMEGVFTNNLCSLKQLSLIDWKIDVANGGERFVGPYTLDCEITFTSKYFYWKRINELTKIFEEVNESLEQMLVSA